MYVIANGGVWHNWVILGAKKKKNIKKIKKKHWNKQRKFRITKTSISTCSSHLDVLNIGEQKREKEKNIKRKNKIKSIQFSDRERKKIIEIKWDNSYKERRHQKKAQKKKKINKRERKIFLFFFSFHFIWFR